MSKTTQTRAAAPQEKPVSQKYPAHGAGYGLTRLFWFAPVMVLLGLCIRQGSIIEWLFPSSQGGAVEMVAANSASITETPTPAQLIYIKPVSTGTPTPDASRIEIGGTPLPTASPTPELVLSHLSFYWPPYEGINCDYECEHIANGDIWQKWVGKGVACPTRYPLGTLFVIMGNEWECVDRGEAIVVNRDGSIWLDMLLPAMPKGVAWGSLQPVEVRPGPDLKQATPVQ